MSWLDKVNTDLVILAGGELSEDENGTLMVGSGVKAFKPYWTNATRFIEYNIAEFVFRRLQGSKVDRGTARGTQYDMELHFQGLDHLDIAEDFIRKVNYFNPQTGIAPPIKVTHPYYGTLFVQPVSIKQENINYNTSAIRMMVIETIKDNGQEFTKIDAESTITAQAAKVNSGFTQTYAAEVPEPDVFDLQQIRDTLNSSYREISGRLNGYQQDFDKYTQYYNEANAAINTAFYNTNALLSQTQRLLGAPAYFADTLVNRLNMLKVQFELLNREIDRIQALRNRPTQTLKRLYETNAGATIIGMCMATILNITNDYGYRPNVLRIVKTIVDVHNQFLTNLYTLQTLTGGMLGNFIPSPVNITQLTKLVTLTTSNLFAISAGAKQQRVLTLQQDSNLLLLADELYGKADETNINLVKENNNIGLNELLIIKKGREIIYYV
jgi:hypothetical protein